MCRTFGVTLRRLQILVNTSKQRLAHLLLFFSFLFYTYLLLLFFDQSTMATTAVTTRAYPKRKRAEISYHESSSDEVEVDDEYGASDEKLTARSRKVR